MSTTGLKIIHPKAKIGQNVTIDAFVTIGANVEIGDDSWIGANATIMEGVKIGKNCNRCHNSEIISNKTSSPNPNR